MSCYADNTLPLKSKDISIIFDPKAEVTSKKIQSIFMGGDDDFIGVEESNIIGVFYQD